MPHAVHHCGVKDACAVHRYGFKDARMVTQCSLRQVPTSDTLHSTGLACTETLPDGALEAHSRAHSNSSHAASAAPALAAQLTRSTSNKPL